MTNGLLSVAIFLPLVGAIIIALLPASPKLIKNLASFFALVALGIGLFLFFNFESAGGLQFETRVPWIPQIGAYYHIGLDGLNLHLFLLTLILGFLVTLISRDINERVKEHFVWLLVLETSILGVFSSLDLLLFYVFWEIEVIPMYFLISIWGSGRKHYSAIKYVIYTLFGSVFMLVGILSLSISSGTFDVTEIAAMDSSLLSQVLPLSTTFLCLLIGFAVKLPVFPLHTWLPDAHTDAPTSASVMLAGALIKMGGYGMIRVCLGLLPEMAEKYAPILLSLAVVNVVYGAAVTLRQTDIKRLIAYSSISHMGFVLLGIFALGEVSLVGAELQMFSHGMITGLLFAITGIIIHNTHEREISKFGGLAHQMPLASTIFIIGGIGAMGVPTTSGFISEFLTFFGAFSAGARIYTIISLLGILLAAGYILWLIQRVFFGPLRPELASSPDIKPLEVFYCAVFIFFIFLIGLYPTFLVDIIRPAVGLLIG
jgi:NADH-quinone oxidoreductase subunit M